MTEPDRGRIDGEVERTIRRRRMTRAFTPEPLGRDLIDRLLDSARRAPSAGNCQATGFVLLDRPEQVRRYWDTTLPPERRVGFRWPQLLDAPVLVIVTTEPERYPARYREPDKAASNRGSIDRWPVPYWWVDAGAVAQNLLLLAVEQGLGACLFGPFDHEPALRNEFGLDPAQRLVATVALGHRARAGDARATRTIGGAATATAGRSGDPTGSGYTVSRRLRTAARSSGRGELNSMASPVRGCSNRSSAAWRNGRSIARPSPAPP